MSTQGLVYPFVDVGLSRRLERAEAHANECFVEARAEQRPASGAAWVRIAGASAMFDGVGSPLTQTFGLGLFEEVTPEILTRIETFFHERGADVQHEVSPLAAPSLLPLLGGRGYRPSELTSVMFRPLGTAPASRLPGSGLLTVRLASSDERQSWADTSAKGWSEFPEAAALMADLGPLVVSARDVTAFFAELGGRPIATGCLSMSGGVALLAGASTIPEGRKKGAQLALLEARLQYAADGGCDLAMMCAQPGGASQRNAERHGFRIAYTRVKWRLGA